MYVYEKTLSNGSSGSLIFLSLLKHQFDNVRKKDYDTVILSCTRPSCNLLKFSYESTRTFLLNKIARYLTSFTSFYTKIARNDDMVRPLLNLVQPIERFYLGFIHTPTYFFSSRTKHLINSSLFLSLLFIFWKGRHNHCPWKILNNWHDIYLK